MKKTLQNIFQAICNKKLTLKELKRLKLKKELLEQKIQKVSLEIDHMEFMTTIEDLENLITPYIKDKTIVLNTNTKLNDILTPEEKEDIYGCLFEYYGIEIPEENSYIVTFFDLVNETNRLYKIEEEKYDA
jgi:hypothetical protein